MCYPHKLNDSSTMIINVNCYVISNSKLTVIYTRHFRFSDSILYYSVWIASHVKRFTLRRKHDATGNLLLSCTTNSNLLCSNWYKNLLLNSMWKAFEARGQESIHIISIIIISDYSSRTTSSSHLAAATDANNAARLAAALTVTINTNSRSCRSSVGVLALNSWRGMSLSK